MRRAFLFCCWRVFEDGFILSTERPTKKVDLRQPPWYQGCCHSIAI
jgi:hypothetical protein